MNKSEITHDFDLQHSSFASVKGFLQFSDARLMMFASEHKLSFNLSEMLSLQRYFNIKKRAPLRFELDVLNYSWRTNTTDIHKIGRIELDSSNPCDGKALKEYLAMRHTLSECAPISLYDAKWIAELVEDASGYDYHRKPQNRFEANDSFSRHHLLNYNNPYGKIVGIPLGYIAESREEYAVGKGDKVFVFTTESDLSNGDIYACCNDLNQFCYANVSTRGVLSSILACNKGIVLDLNAYSQLNNANKLFFAGSKECIFAAANSSSASQLHGVAASYGYVCKEIGRIITQNTFVAKYNGKTAVELDMDFITGGGCFDYAKIVGEELKIKNAYSGRKLTQNLFLREFKAELGDVNRNVCYGATGKIAVAPFGGRYRATRAQVASTVSRFEDLTVLSSCQRYTERQINSPYLRGVYATVTAVAKLIAAGVLLENIELSSYVSRGTPQSPKELGDELMFRLGVSNARKAISLSYVVNNEERVSSVYGNHSVCAVGELPPERILSNVFNKGYKLFLLPIKFDKNGMVDYKYLLKLFSLVSINIATGNIVASAVVEDNLLYEIANSCLGEQVGFSFAQISSDILKAPFGSLIVAVNDITELVNIDVEYIGVTDATNSMKGADFELSLSEINRAIGLKSNYGLSDNAPLGMCPAKSLQIITKKFVPSVFVPKLDKTAGILAAEFEKVNAKTSVLNVSYDRETIKEIRRNIEKSDIFVLSATNKVGVDSRKAVSAFLADSAVFDALNEMIFRRDGLVLAIGDAFYSFVEAGFLPYGRKINDVDKPKIRLLPTERNTGRITRASVVENVCHWYDGIPTETLFPTVTTDMEMRLDIDKDLAATLFSNGQICSRYVGGLGYPTEEYPDNPCGNSYAVQSVCSADGRILGEVGHNYKISAAINIGKDKPLNIFANSVKYFK